MLRGLAFCFALFFFHDFFAQFSFRGERAPVYYAKTIVLLGISQGSFLSSCVLSNFSTGVVVWVAGSSGQLVTDRAFIEMQVSLTIPM